MMEGIDRGPAASKQTYRVRRYLGLSSLTVLRKLGAVLKVREEGASQQVKNLHRYSESAHETEQGFSDRFPLLKD